MFYYVFITYTDMVSSTPHLISSVCLKCIYPLQGYNKNNKKCCQLKRATTLSLSLSRAQSLKQKGLTVTGQFSLRRCLLTDLATVYLTLTHSDSLPLWYC